MIRAPCFGRIAYLTRPENDTKYIKGDFHA